MSELNLQQPFTDRFPGDETYNPVQRQTPGKLYALVHPLQFKEAELIAVNKELALQFGFEFPLNPAAEKLLNASVSDEIPTYATAYAGHQFGHWAGQLGDGRAIFAGEITDKNGQPWELQWKGAGATPYSRHADGRAVLRSTIREYLMSEAMYHLGVPTTRGLSLSLTGEKVVRDIMYDGNPAFEKGALMVRTAESFLRFGHFEWLNAQGDVQLLQNLADWTIQRYFKEIHSEGKQKYLDFFREVRDRTLEMIIHWLRVGFVHGVMNTDNMSVLGLTIDYGPYAMMEEYDLKFTSNTTDLPGMRYAFGKQGNIALWNLNALANALFPLIQEVELLQEMLDEFEGIFWNKFDAMMLEKLGITSTNKTKASELLKEWQLMMIDLKPDYTLFFVELMKWHEEKTYQPENFMYTVLTTEQENRLQKFLRSYKGFFSSNEAQKSAFNRMKKVNPQFILRNFQLYKAAQEAENGNFDYFFRLNEALKNPYENRFDDLQQKRPDWASGVPGCSMLSCSS